MVWMPEDLKEYDHEVQFQVGQLVEVDIDVIPFNERDCTWGLIVGIHTRFPLTPQYRLIEYDVKLAGSYNKKEYRIISGIKGNIRVLQNQIKLKK